VKSFVSVAVSKSATFLERSKLPTDINATKTNAFRIQRWYRSRSVYKITTLAATTDGRVSRFGLPIPDLSKYKQNQRTPQGARKPTRLKNEIISASYVQSFWRSNCETPKLKEARHGRIQYQLSNEPLVASSSFTSNGSDGARVAVVLDKHSPMQDEVSTKTTTMDGMLKMNATTETDTVHQRLSHEFMNKVVDACTR
jgi:hypothetical protein